ncbi:KdsC family phosphatase [Mesobacillus jeotgali]|uniref:KdsC family phosphatase n=1 Tax=Mesobacillus jeotgali TaxID=129985 RepID=UPI001CFF1C03|nr:HAD-IIIA family hydrolase [Mesobacillus jeotgali]
MMINKDLSNIRMLVMDVDGTLTDGKIYIGEHGEIFKAFNVKDGYRLNSLDKYSIIPVIITGRNSAILSRRAAELNISEVHQGIDNKLEVLDEIIDRHNLKYENVAYIGDDINDIECMKACGFNACPADAVQEVIQTVDYVCKLNGGEGAVRELIDLLIVKEKIALSTP